MTYVLCSSRREEVMLVSDFLELDKSQNMINCCQIPPEYKSLVLKLQNQHYQSFNN